MAPYLLPPPVDRFAAPEGPRHICEALGVYVMLHFCAQFGFYALTGEMHLHLPFMWPHLALHASSFALESVPSRAGVLALRQFMCVLYPAYGPMHVIATMTAADSVARAYGTPGDISRASRSLLPRATGALSSISQLGGTLICSGAFQPKGVNPILVFASLPAIQASTFGTALLRKNLIETSTLDVLYTLQLLLVSWIWHAEYGDLWILPISCFLYAARGAGVSKYLIWSLIGIVSPFTHYGVTPGSRKNLFT